MSKITITIAWGLMLAAAVGGCQPEADKAPAAPDPDGARLVADEYLAAINSGDAAAAAEFWTKDSKYVNETAGVTLTGRDALRKAFAEAFSPEFNAKIEITHQEFNVIAPGVVSEQGRSRITPGVGPIEHARFVAIYVFRDGNWKVHRVWQTDAPVASNYEHLASLSWMIGEWDGEKSDGREIKNVCRWSKNRNFIMRTYKVLEKGEVLVKGTEIIGWDPFGKRVRSWAFDSAGGFSEGVWRFEGDQWRPTKVIDAEPTDLSEHHKALEGLAWLVGRWTDDKASFTATCRWADNKSFIIQRFRVAEEGDFDQEGIRIFGLDPDLGRIRSWMFDTDGGLAESTWTRSETGDEWQAKTRHVMPDGRLASSIGICRKIDENSVAWRRIDQELDGELLPNGPLVTLVRQAADK